MRYVLDSSVALEWVLPEADSDKALRLRHEYSNGRIVDQGDGRDLKVHGAEADALPA